MQLAETVLEEHLPDDTSVYVENKLFPLFLLPQLHSLVPRQ